MVDKHNYLAPLAAEQPEYVKDSEYDTNHKVNFRVILENAEVQSYVPAKENFSLSYTKTRTLRDIVTLHTDFTDTYTYGESDFAYLTVITEEGFTLHDRLILK